MLLVSTYRTLLCCVPAVMNRTVEFCRRHSELRVPAMTSSRTGSSYVASLTTSDAPTCALRPWSVEASPGQRVNITMWDFTTVDDRRLSSSSSVYGSATVARPPPAPGSVKRPRKTNTGGDDDDGGGGALFVEPGVTCRKYAVVQDGDRQLTLCGGSRRLAGSYESRDSGVKVWIVAGVAPNDRQRFLLQFTGLARFPRCPLRSRQPASCQLSTSSSVRCANICHLTAAAVSVLLLSFS